MPTTVGRAWELLRVNALLESDSPYAMALVLEGAPGIGEDDAVTGGRRTRRRTGSPRPARATGRERERAAVHGAQRPTRRAHNSGFADDFSVYAMCVATG
ncbi:MAG TPA: hypothetical protein VI409_14535 [Gaiellaceae bacterium]|nr:hypothetical protein [Gaiellaceae bacterium]